MPFEETHDMLKRLDRYFYKELGLLFLLNLTLLTFFLLINQFLRLMEVFLNRGAGILMLGKIFLLILPSFLLVTIPVSTLIAALVSFSRFTADGELLALKSSGISFLRIIRPLFFFSLAATLLSYALSIYTTPWSGTSFKDMAVNLLKANAAVGIEAGIFNDISDRLMIYVNRVDSDKRLNGILISDLRKPNEPILIVAKEGRLIQSNSAEFIGFRLHQGTIHHRDEDPSSYERVMFSTYDLKIELDSDLTAPSGQPTLREINNMLAESKGQDVRALRYLEEYHRNFSFPFACFIFGILGAPLGIGFKRSGRLGGFVIGILVVLVYYSVSVWGDILVAGKYVVPWVGAWLPNILSLLLTPIILWKFSKK